MNIRTHGRKRNFFVSCSCMLSGLILASAAVPSHAQDDRWQFEVSPSLWFAASDSSIRTGGLALDTSTSFSDTFDDLEFGFTGAFEARKGRWGVLFDSMYVNTSQATGLNAELEITQQTYGLAGTWRALEGMAPVDVLGGVRYNNVESTLSSPALNRSDREEAFDPYIGVRGQLPLSPQWTLVGYADVGSISGEDVAWQVLAGASYAFNESMTGKFGYRYYRLEYDEGGVEFDNAVSGIYAGIGFRF